MTQQKTRRLAALAAGSATAVAASAGIGVASATAAPSAPTAAPAAVAGAKGASVQVKKAHHKAARMNVGQAKLATSGQKVSAAQAVTAAGKKRGKRSRVS